MVLGHASPRYAIGDRIQVGLARCEFVVQHFLYLLQGQPLTRFDRELMPSCRIARGGEGLPLFSAFTMRSCHDLPRRLPCAKQARVHVDPLQFSSAGEVLYDV